MKDDLKREVYEDPTMEVVDISTENTILTSASECVSVYACPSTFTL